MTRRVVVKSPSFSSLVSLLRRPNVWTPACHTRESTIFILLSRICEVALCSAAFGAFGNTFGDKSQQISYENRQSLLVKFFPTALLKRSTGQFFRTQVYPAPSSNDGSPQSRVLRCLPVQHVGLADCQLWSGEGELSTSPSLFAVSNIKQETRENTKAALCLAGSGNDGRARVPAFLRFSSEPGNCLPS